MTSSRRVARSDTGTDQRVPHSVQRCATSSGAGGATSTVLDDLHWGQGSVVMVYGSARRKPFLHTLVQRNQTNGRVFLG